MAKKYTIAEMNEMNFKRIKGMSRKEYGEKVARDQLAKQKTFEAPKTEAPNYEKASPDYKFTAEKPIKQNYVRDILSNPHTGSPWDANNAVYDMDKYNEDLAKYNTAVSEANKRAISDITKKDQQGEAVKGLPSLTQQNMINEMKPHIETDSFQRMKNIVAAEREKNPEAFEKAVAKGKSGAEKHSYYNTMSGDERTELAYLIGSGNKTNLEAYLKSGESTFKQKESDRNALAVKKKAEQNPAFGVAANLAGGIVSPTSYIGEVVNQGAGLFTGVNEPLPEYSKWNAAARIEKSSREGLTEGKSETPAFLINVGLSIGQNLVRLPLSIFGGGTGEVLSLVSMASSAAGQTVYEAVQRGATGGQALLLGTVAGGVEYLTEKISLDKLLTLGKDSVRIFSKEAAQGIVRQMVSEGGEEMISEVANIIADSLIMGDKSELISMYNSYLESGMSKKDAEANTIWHTVLNIGLAGLGGALSGGVLGGGGTVVGAIKHNLNTETQNAANKRGLESLIDEGKTYGTDTGAYKVATKVEDRLSKGKKIGNYTKGQLYNENAIAQKEQLKAVEKTVEKAKTEELKSEAKTEVPETANGFTFEKAEEPKVETKLPKPYEASAIERFNALGENGKKGYSERANELMDENGNFDEESFAREFERAYIVGHAGLTEQQAVQHLNMDVSKDPILLTAFNNGKNDRTAELTAAKQKVQQGISVSDKVGLERNDIANSLSPKSFSVWDKVGKQLGIKIQLVDNIDGNKNVMGKYKDGVLQVNVKGDRPMWSIAAHEVTHRIKEVSPEAFETFKSEVVSALGSEYENRYNEVAKRYRTTGEKTNADIEEEVLSEYAEELFDSEEKFEQLANKNSGLAERLIEAFKEFIGKIKAALGKGTSAETNQLDSIVKAWENAYSNAVKTVKGADHVEASDNEKTAYVKTLKDGRRVYNSDIDPSLSEEERLKLFKDRIAMVFNFGMVTLKTDVKTISPKGDRFTYSKNLQGDNYATSTEMNTKVSALYDLADILNNSLYQNKNKEESYQTNVPPKNKAHKGVKYWYKYSTDIVFDGMPVTVTFNIRDKGKEQFVYLIDVNEDKKMKANIDDTFRSKPELASARSLSNNSISDKNGKSETENAQNGEEKSKYALSKSIEDMSAEELSEAYTESVEERQAIASYLKDGAAVPTATKTRSMTKELLNEFGSNYDIENASALVHNLYMELSTGFDKDGNKLTESEIDSHIERTAKRFIKASTETNTDLFEESKPMRQKIRNTEILISENDIEDFGGREDFNEFKKSNFGRMPKLKVTDTAGNIDKVYQELSSEYPDFFAEDITHPADQLKVISNVFDLVQPTETYLYEDSEETAVKNMSNAIYDSWFMYNHDNKTRAAIDNLHQKKLLEWRKEAHRIQKRAQKIYAEVREQGRQEIKEEIQKVKDNVKKAREIRTRNAMEKAIVGAVKWLKRNRKLKGAEEALAKIDSEVGEIIKPLVGDIPKGKTVVDTLQNFLDDYLKAHNDVFFVEAVRDYADRGLNNKLEAVDKLEEILELVQMARHDVKTAHEQFLKDRDGNYFEIAKNVIDEIANANGIKDSSGLGAALSKLQMSPYTFFRYISGYADNSALQSLFSEMLEAENKSLLLAREGFEQFASLVGTSSKDKDLRKKRKDFDEKIITVKLGGRNVRTTAAFVVALKLHTENPQNMAALMSGITMPEIELYNKGKKAEAWRKSKAFVPTLDEINEAYNKLDDYAKSWRGVYKSFSDYWSKNHLNEASEKALGIKIASVDNYIHIRRNPDFLNSSFESMLKAENGGVKIQNSGALKDRVETSNKPILIESLTDVIQDQIRLVSEYAGKIEVLTKADKIFNAKLEDGRTFKSVLNEKFGQFGKDYLFKFISDYNGGNKAKSDYLSKLAKGFRGNFAKYVLGANITTAAVQSTAALNGAAEFGWDNYVKSLGRKKSLTLDDIKPYTARATARESGYINTELADKMSSVRLFDQADKISNFFMKGIAISDRKAINSILRQAQTYVETTQPDLKYASKEYYEAVVRAFDRAVNLTQQGNTIALRPEMFRTDNELLRIMGMFSSEAVKNGNLILDGYLNYQAKKTSYQNNQSAANKEALIKAKTEYANKVTSVVAVNIVSAVAVSVLKALFKGQWDKYFDEEGFPTPTTEGLLNTFGDFMESMVSSVVFGKYLAGLTEAVIKGGKAVFEFIESDDPDKKLSSSDFTTTIKQTMEETVPELDLIVSFFTKGWNAATSLIEAFAVQSDEAVSNAIRDGDKLFVSFMALLGLPAQNFKTFVLGTADTVTRIPQFIDNSIGLEARYDLLKVRYNAYSTAHRKYFYDLLYQAYLLDDRTAYRNIRRDLLEKGYTHQALDSAIEKRRKEDREKQRKK